jgi:hypothetical protein
MYYFFGEDFARPLLQAFVQQQHNNNIIITSSPRRPSSKNNTHFNATR